MTHGYTTGTPGTPEASYDIPRQRTEDAAPAPTAAPAKPGRDRYLDLL
ncbi:acyltransferase, partial [Streptomyces sp. TRM76130]|nr:acyltransferase [Streptomyces sp. TRM76130]